MKIDGRCHCGQISFTAETDSDGITLCHCTDCQMLSGSAFRANISVPAAHVVFQGAVATYVKTGDSGSRRRHGFCGTCGTPIYACVAEEPARYSLRIGTITQRAAFSPKRQIWRRSAVPWVGSLAEVPASEKG